MAASPVGPAELVGCVMDWLDDECDEQALDLVAGQRHQVGRPGTVGVFVSTDDGEEGVGEHGEGDPAGPGWVAADLVLIESGQPLLGLEGFFHPPSGSGDPHQLGQRHRLG